VSPPRLRLSLETAWLLLHWLAWLWLATLILVVLRLHGDL
jgi:hypothetical protein